MSRYYLGMAVGSTLVICWYMLGHMKVAVLMAGVWWGCYAWHVSRKASRKKSA